MLLGPQDTKRSSFISSALVAQTVKNPSAVQETQAQTLGQIPWRRAWQPTPASLPRESHGQRASRATVHGAAKSDTTEPQSTHPHSPWWPWRRPQEGPGPLFSPQTLRTFPRGQVLRHPSSHTSLIEPLPSWGHRPEPHSQPTSFWSSNLQEVDKGHRIYNNRLPWKPHPAWEGCTWALSSSVLNAPLLR